MGGSPELKPALQLQRRQSSDGREGCCRDHADRLRVRRCRHHRSASPSHPSPQEVEGRVGVSDPRLYASGAAAARFASLRQYGLDVRVLQGPLSAASALKISYAGINKGMQAIGAAMMLAAMRAG
jgi:hypothetical protein